MIILSIYTYCLLVDTVVIMFQRGSPWRSTDPVSLYINVRYIISANLSLGLNRIEIYISTLLCGNNNWRSSIFSCNSIILLMNVSIQARRIITITRGAPACPLRRRCAFCHSDLQFISYSECHSNLIQQISTYCI